MEVASLRHCLTRYTLETEYQDGESVPVRRHPGFISDSSFESQQPHLTSTIGPFIYLLSRSPDAEKVPTASDILFFLGTSLNQLPLPSWPSAGEVESWRSHSLSRKVHRSGRYPNQMRTFTWCSRWVSQVWTSTPPVAEPSRRNRRCVPFGTSSPRSRADLEICAS